MHSFPTLKEQIKVAAAYRSPWNNDGLLHQIAMALTLAKELILKRLIIKIMEKDITKTPKIVYHYNKTMSTNHILKIGYSQVQKCQRWEASRLGLLV